MPTIRYEVRSHNFDYNGYLLHEYYGEKKAIEKAMELEQHFKLTQVMKITEECIRWIDNINGVILDNEEDIIKYKKTPPIPERL